VEPTDTCPFPVPAPDTPAANALDDVDLVVLAELCDAFFEGDPSDRDRDPHLFAIVDSFGAFSIMEFGPVSYLQLHECIVPPPRCRALVLQCGGWAAPLDPDGGIDGSGRIVDGRSRPSRHPLRRRMFSTTVIGNDVEIVTMMRIAGDAEPQLLTGECAGRVPDAMRACWSRRTADRAA
jgi:hypothetical protein